VHTRVSGVGDLEVGSEDECIETIRSYLSFFPSNCEEPPPRRHAADPIDRSDDDLRDVLPDSPRHPYDMYDVIRRIVDDGDWFDLKPRWARTIITCLARMGGRPLGIVANQPKYPPAGGSGGLELAGAEHRAWPRPGGREELPAGRRRRPSHRRVAARAGPAHRLRPGPSTGPSASC
jgi:acetyl-CoA carboxylase carboxyltransferase component